MKEAYSGDIRRQRSGCNRATAQQTRLTIIQANRCVRATPSLVPGMCASRSRRNDAPEELRLCLGELQETRRSAPCRTCAARVSDSVVTKSILHVSSNGREPSLWPGEVVVVVDADAGTLTGAVRRARAPTPEAVKETWQRARTRHDARAWSIQARVEPFRGASALSFRLCVGRSAPTSTSASCVPHQPLPLPIAELQGLCITATKAKCRGTRVDHVLTHPKPTV